MNKSKFDVRIKPLILLDKVKIVPSDNNGPLHFGTVASTG